MGSPLELSWRRPRRITALHPQVQKCWRTIRASLERVAPPTDAAVAEFSVSDPPLEYIAMKVSEDRGTSTGASSSTPSGSAKRSRDPEDEVYLDNLHSSKRYLSEVEILFCSGNHWLNASLWNIVEWMLDVCCGADNGFKFEWINSRKRGKSHGFTC